MPGPNTTNIVDNVAPADTVKVYCDKYNAHWHPTNVIAKTSTYPVVAGDVQKLIDCTSGTFSLTLLAAATAGDGFWFMVRNSGTGVITIDPNGPELIDGASTITIGPSGSATIVCTGTAWKSVGRAGEQVVRKASDQVVVNNSTTLTNVTGLSLAIGATEVVNFWLHVWHTANAAGDLKLGFTGPAAFTMRWAPVNSVYVDTADVLAVFSSNQAGDAFNTGASSATERRLTTLWCRATGVGTAGTVQLQAAQVTAHASDLTVFAESLMLLYRGA